MGSGTSAARLFGPLWAAYAARFNFALLQFKTGPNFFSSVFVVIPRPGGIYGSAFISLPFLCGSRPMFFVITFLPTSFLPQLVGSFGDPFFPVNCHVFLLAIVAL
jgi:hypothetical protein